MLKSSPQISEVKQKLQRAYTDWLLVKYDAEPDPNQHESGTERL